MERSPFLVANSGSTQEREQGPSQHGGQARLPALSRSQDGGAEGPAAGPGAPARPRVR